jgi:hypothetical protein
MIPGGFNHDFELGRFPWPNLRNIDEVQKVFEDPVVADEELMDKIEEFLQGVNTIDIHQNNSVPVSSPPASGPPISGNPIFSVAHYLGCSSSSSGSSSLSSVSDFLLLLSSLFSPANPISSTFHSSFNPST